MADIGQPTCRSTKTALFNEAYVYFSRDNIQIISDFRGRVETTLRYRCKTLDRKPRHGPILTEV